MFATDEPVVIDGVNATTVLVRRVKQGVAEWFRLQLKEKTWKGLVEHSLDGWNIGPAPYGYPADRIPHPVPVKASQGRTKTRLTLDPARAPVVEQIFTWRIVDKLGMPTIAARLNADPARYPAPRPGPGWTTQTVYAILGNPKYTGHMVYGRRRTRNGRRVTVPPDQWLWSPEPVHPAIVDRATWDAAQARRRRARHQPRRPPACPRTRPRPGPTPTGAGSGAGTAAAGWPAWPTARGPACVYYQCPHNPAHPQDAADHPGHPRTVKAPETRLDQIVGLFFAEHIFGPGRAELLAAQLPATDAAAAADRDAQAAALHARLKQIETAPELQHPRDSNSSPPTPPTPPPPRCAPGSAPGSPSSTTNASRLETQLAALAQITPKAADPTLLDQLPAGRGHPARPAPAAQSPPVRRLRPAGPVEQARPAGHRLRRDHRRHPPGPPRHPRPRPGRIR